MGSYIKHDRLCSTTIPKTKTKKEVENMTHSGVLLVNFEVLELWSDTRPQLLNIYNASLSGN